MTVASVVSVVRSVGMLWRTAAGVKGDQISSP